MAAFSGPSTGCPLGRSGLSKGPTHPRHAPLGLLERFGGLINGLPPPDLDCSQWILERGQQQAARYSAQLSPISSSTFHLFS